MYSEAIKEIVILINIYNMDAKEMEEIEFLNEMNLISLERKVEEAKKELAYTKLMKEVFFKV